RKGCKDRVLLLPPVAVAKLQVVPLLGTSDVHIGKVALVLWPKPGDHISFRIQGMACCVEVLLVFEDHVDRKPRDPGLELIVEQIVSVEVSGEQTRQLAGCISKHGVSKAVRCKRACWKARQRRAARGSAGATRTFSGNIDAADGAVACLGGLNGKRAGLQNRTGVVPLQREEL